MAMNNPGYGFTPPKPAMPLAAMIRKRRGGQKMPSWGAAVIVGAAVLLLWAGPVGAAQTVLVRQGVPEASIVLPADATDIERLAATELQIHISKMSGAELPIVTSPNPGKGARIVIGRAAPRRSQGTAGDKPDDPASFRIQATDDRVLLAGRSAQGTLFAAYDLLEQLGVRWFMPGEIGTVIPQSRTVAVRQQDTVQHPAFSPRMLPAVGDAEWSRRMRLGGIYLGGHGLPVKADPKTEPELFVHENGRPTQQLRVSNPEVLRRTIEGCRERLRRDPNLRYIGMGPEDGAGFGADPWDADDIDPLNGRVSVTDRYIKFFNLVLDGLQKDYPEVGVAFYCYSDYMRPPVREKPNRRILPVFAPIDCCRLHSVDNPICWERHSYIERTIEGWQALGLKMTYRGYLFNLADPGLPFSMIRQVRTEFPYYHAKGMLGMTPECHPAWSYHGPALYLAAKMAWDPHLDVDATLDDYFSTFYGPAAGAMRAHFDCLEDAFAGADYHTGNVFDMPHILTPGVVAKLELTLSEAEKQAPAGSVYAGRIHMTRMGLEFGKAQLKMMAALNAFDFVEARKQLTRIQDEIVPAAVAHEPPALNPDYAPGFVKRFWEPAVRQGYERVTNGNEMVAKLPDEWRVMLEPSGHGDDLGLWQPDAGSGSWTPLKTYSQSWSNQGLRYYKGDAWYRTSVEVAERYRGRSMRLWLSGIDEQAAAWINGKKLAVLREGSAPIGGPWEFDATDAIAFGGPNVVVVKVSNSNRELNELGTGGITGPAMLWAAAK
jgi:hypothetical protein